MGLIYTASGDNRTLQQGLTVTYSKRRLYQPYTYLSQINVLTTINYVWEYHRYAVKTYSYVGMDYEAAKSKAKELVNSYTRSCYISAWQSGGKNAGTFVTERIGDKLQADISVQKYLGHMYTVVVDIHEDDVRLSTDGSISPAGLFALEDARRYDY